MSARLEKFWNDHRLVVVAGVTVIALALAVALIWPITDLIAAHDVGLITGSKRAAALQTAREAVRTQLLTLGAGVFAAGALAYTARNFTLSRTTFRATEVRVLNERFATAAEKLGDDKPPAVRLAGMYAMAGLADDWEANRQVCIDVLCGYLRIASTQLSLEDASSAPRDSQADREVRHALIRTITAHLRDGAAVSWQGKDFDLTGVVFDGGDFSYARFSGGTVSFRYAQFVGGTVSFRGARFSGGTVDFGVAEFSGGTVSFSVAQFSTGGTVSFNAALFSTGGTVWFNGAEFSGGTVSFNADFTGGTVDFGAEFSGGTVSFAGAHFTGGTVSFDGAQFSPGGDVSFRYTQFTGATVNFNWVRFVGGTVDFSLVDAWSHPPSFNWQGTPPAGVKLPEGIGGEAQ
jgi:hypothetical protein